MSDDDEPDEDACPEYLDGEHRFELPSARRTPIAEWFVERCTCGATRELPDEDA